MKTPKKKREATPKALKDQPASVDAPPVSSVNRNKSTSTIQDSRQELDKSDIPEELEPVWDLDIAKAFQALRPQQQDFLLCYLREGNAAAAYRHAYNKLAKDHLASVSGSQMLASLGIQPILLKFASIKTEALFTVIHGYREMAQATKPNFVQDEEGQWMNAGDLPDWQARKEAMIGIRKIHGLDAADKVEHSGQIATTHKYDIPNKRPVGT